MTKQEAEVTLRQILNSPWVNLTWKLGAALAPFVFAVGVWVLNDIKGEAASAREAAALVKIQLETVTETQQDRADIADDRAAASDLFQEQIVAKVEDLGADVTGISSDVTEIGKSIAGVQGSLTVILSQMQRNNDVALRTVPTELRAP